MIHPAVRAHSDGGNVKLAPLTASCCRNIIPCEREVSCQKVPKPSNTDRRPDAVRSRCAPCSHACATASAAPWRACGARPTASAASPRPPTAAASRGSRRRRPSRRTPPLRPGKTLRLQNRSSSPPTLVPRARLLPLKQRGRNPSPLLLPMAAAPPAAFLQSMLAERQSRVPRRTVQQWSPEPLVLQQQRNQERSPAQPSSTPSAPPARRQLVSCRPQTPRSRSALS